MLIIRVPGVRTLLELLRLLFCGFVGRQIGCRSYLISLVLFDYHHNFIACLWVQLKQASQWPMQISKWQWFQPSFLPKEIIIGHHHSNK